MPRPRYESDDRWNDRRGSPKPHVKIHHAVKNHPKTAEAWADPELRGMLVELWRLASERGAAHTDDRLVVTPGDIVSITGRTQYAHATRALRTLCERVGYAMSTRGECVEIIIRKFAKRQNLTPRKPRSTTPDSAAAATPPLSPLLSPQIPPTPFAESEAPPSVQDEEGNRPIGQEDPEGDEDPDRATVLAVVRLAEEKLVPIGIPIMNGEQPDVFMANLRSRIETRPKLGDWAYLLDQVPKQPWLLTRTFAWMLESEQRLAAVRRRSYEKDPPLRVAAARRP